MSTSSSPLLLPPLSPITDDDHGGYVIFTTFAALLLTLAFWVVRLFVRWRKRIWAADDLVLILAFVIAIPQSICVHLAVRAGLGRRETAEYIDNDRLFKLFYAAQLWSIISQTCSKASVSLLFGSFAAYKPFVFGNHLTLALIACWGLTSTFTLAFECHVPLPWRFEASNCVDLKSLNIGIDSGSIAIEALLMLLPATFMPKVQTRWSIRLVVIVAFAARFFVVATLIGQIHVAANFVHYDTLSWTLTLPAIWMQLTMNASVLTACVPGLQEVLAHLRPGMTSLVVAEDGQINDYSKSSSVFGGSGRDARNNSTRAWELHTINTPTESKARREDSRVEIDSIRELRDEDGD